MADSELGTVVRHIRRLAAFQATQGMTDRQLLEGFLAHGDEPAFATLLKRHGPLVLAVCRRVLSHQQDAEDVFQATFLVLAQSAASIRKTEALAAWLHGVAHRLALKAKRGAARRRAHERKVGAVPRISKSEDSMTLGLCNFAEVQVILDEEIQRLPEKYRAVFVPCCLEGQSRVEVAKDLGLKEGTVRSRLSEARKRLQQRLARRGVTLSALLGAAAIAESATRAAVPGALAATTLRSALLFVERCGSAVTAVAPGFVSPKVIALAKGAHKAFYMTKGKTLSALLLAVGLAAAGAGVLAQRDRVTPPTRLQATLPQVEKHRPPKLIPEKQARLDQYGDPLPEGATARLGTMRWRHGYLISSFVFSPDSKTLVSGGEDSIIRIWDATTGKGLRRLAGHREGVHGIALSGDGKTLVSCGEDRTVRLWEMATGKELRQLVGHEGRVLAVAISPDGKTIASGGSDKAVRLWNVVDGKPIHHLVAHQLEVASLAFSPDGKMLASASAPWLHIVPPRQRAPRLRSHEDFGAFPGK